MIEGFVGRQIISKKNENGKVVEEAVGPRKALRAGTEKNPRVYSLEAGLADYLVKEKKAKEVK